MTKIKGVDISYYQEGINFAELKKAGVEFAIIRAGYSTKKDNTMDKFISDCKEYGIPYGFYWYSYAMSIDEARAEAEKCVEVIKGLSPVYPVFFDMEEKKQIDGLTNDVRTEMAIAFCETVKAAGFTAGIYAKRVRKPQEEWLRVEDTHEAIIAKDVFAQVQEQIAGQRRQMKDATTQIFAGLVRCADCGWSMRFGTNKSNKTPYSYFNCTSYQQFGKTDGTCTAHYIRYDALYAYVLSRIQYWAGQAELDEEQLLQRLLKSGDKERTAKAKKQTDALAKAEKRKTEVDKLFTKMYEDWSAERITDYNFNMLSQKYQSELQELAEKIDKLKAELSAEQQTASDAEKWISLIKRYANPTELTAELLNTLIEKIVIHEAVKNEDGIREQEVEIFYRFVGRID